MTYVPLHITTHHSIGKSLLTTDALIAWAHENNIPALGVVDHNTLEGALKMSKAMIAAGVQPMIGVTLTTTLDGVTGNILAYAKNAQGQQALLRATNLVGTQQETPNLEDLANSMVSTQDVIILTGGEDGFVQKSDTPSNALNAIKNLFENVFVELARTDRKGPFADADIISLANSTNTPLVATVPADHAKAEDETALDTYMCIVNKDYVSERDRKGAKRGTVLVTESRMRDIFADVPQSVDNTIAIAKMCNSVVVGAKPMMPIFDNNIDAVAQLSNEAQTGLSKRLAKANAQTTVYDERLAFELGVITKMGYADYFLIVADFIGWARKNGIAVGPGRGSGAGSLVAYALGITDVDPIAHNLLFERFLNPDRVSLPDFDVDFCQNRREEVIAYVRQRYGQERVAHIGTYGTLKARAVVRAVGRVMQLPYNMVNRYAAMIPETVGGGSLIEAMEGERLKEELERADDSVRTLFETALKIEGLWSHKSVHAAGVIIAPQPVAEIVPVTKDEQGLLVTAYDMHQAEAAGLIKFDFLGLKNLDILEEAIKLIKEQDNVDIDLRNLPFDDASVFETLSKGDGFGVFQVESFGMRQAMKTVKVDSFEDIEAILALYRPGPMDNIETYAKIKAGEQHPDWAHKALEEILTPTHGVMIYQEQVMKSAQNLSGYSLAQADLLRRAMGKKNPVEMDAQRERFVEGAQTDQIEVTLDDGRTLNLHPMTLVPLKDGNGKMVSVQDAIEQSLDVVL